ncbi:MAG: FAD-dependent oxidoreductase [Myxococcales bacterium]|nr:FAD-dependent oxidoreductase [Myxococcales bacterium]
MKAIVIGGGFAGLAAATRLAEEGHAVTLLERRPILGGRAYSIVDETTGDVIDNGQHLFLGCYRATRAFLARIGTSDKLALRDDLTLTYLEGGRLKRVTPSTLPAPFGLLAGLARFEALSFTERLLALRVAAALKAPSRLAPAATERETVTGWLARLSQSEGARRAFWNPIAIAALNDDPQIASARMFEAVLKEAFLGTAEDARFGVPRVGLSELYCDGAARFLAAREAVVRLAAPVAEVRVRSVSGTRSVEGVILRDGQRLDAEVVIAAVPPRAVLELIPEAARKDEHYFDGLAHLGTSPIVSIHLWFDRLVTDEPLFGLLDSPIHWVFNRNQLGAVKDPSRSHLSLVISAARALCDRPPEELIERGLRELQKALPTVAAARLVHARVIKEREATIAHKAGADHLRPKPRTPIDGLFLAGDYVRTGLPATIESAVRSADTAVRMAVEYEPPPPPPPPKGFIPIGNLTRKTSGTRG